MSIKNKCDDFCVTTLTAAFMRPLSASSIFIEILVR